MRRFPDDQPDLVQAEPGFWRKLTGLFDRSSDAVIVNRRAPPQPQAQPAPWPEAEPSHTAVPTSPPEPAPSEDHIGDEFLIHVWREGQASRNYDRAPGGAIGAVYMLADSPVGDWIYKTFLKPRRPRR